MMLRQRYLDICPNTLNESGVDSGIDSGVSQSFLFLRCLDHDSLFINKGWWKDFNFSYIKLTTIGSSHYMPLSGF